jgi:hypothetical protein
MSTTTKATPKKTAKPKAELLTVKEIARELKMNGKVARAKLRRAGMKSEKGRWPEVARDSKEHLAIVAVLTGEGE